MITETTRAILPVAENIPRELARRPQWVCWRYEQRSEAGKPTKVPYVPNTKRRASCSDLLTWRPFEEALAAYEADEDRNGIGFVFSSGDPYAGVDLDGCRDPENGEIEPWAQEILDQVGDDAYREISVSGTGIHVIVRGRVRGGGMRKGPVEMYSRERFFAMTGIAP